MHSRLSYLHTSYKYKLGSVRITQLAWRTIMFKLLWLWNTWQTLFTKPDTHAHMHTRSLALAHSLSLSQFIVMMAWCKKKACKCSFNDPSLKKILIWLHTQARTHVHTYNNTHMHICLCLRVHAHTRNFPFLPFQKSSMHISFPLCECVGQRLIWLTLFSAHPTWLSLWKYL